MTKKTALRVIAELGWDALARAVVNAYVEQGLPVPEGDWEDEAEATELLLDQLVA